MMKTMLNTLFGNKVDLAIERLRTYEPLTRGMGFYLAFSGGKDSCVIKRLAEMAGVKFDAHYSMTTIDPPELVYFIRDYHKDVVWHRPEKTFLQRVVTKGMPLRQGRWCCEYLKEGGGEGRFVVTGVRWAESPKRAKRNMIETCYRDLGKQ
jgi:phosphoadenosine phosphosulfate reductase